MPGSLAASDDRRRRFGESRDGRARRMGSGHAAATSGSSTGRGCTRPEICRRTAVGSSRSDAIRHLRVPGIDRRRARADTHDRTV